VRSDFCAKIMDHEKTFRDRGSGFDVVQYINPVTLFLNLGQ